MVMLFMILTQGQRIIDRIFNLYSCIQIIEKVKFKESEELLLCYAQVIFIPYL